jgi:UDP-N-acetyl-2-amino-2-deoxyglucuronate dehydrogenase
MKRFILIGIGYVSPKHMKAIKDNSGELIAALDPHDSVGILDSYFPDCHFFTEFERFDRHCSKLIDSGTKIDYVSIASPNYLHDAHCRFALRIGADAICEKPLVLKERNLDQLKTLEEKTNQKIYTILQLRLNKKLIELKNEILISSAFQNILIEYITPRGRWYEHSWKGNFEKSGGIHYNIGIHLFDLVTWLLGPPTSFGIHKYSKNEVIGRLNFGNHASCNFHLSTEGTKPKRSIVINNEEIEFSNGFTDLHTLSYQKILEGEGFGIEEARLSIRLCEKISTSLNKFNSNFGDI